MAAAECPRRHPPYHAGCVALIWPDAFDEWIAPMAAQWQQHLSDEATILTVPGHHDTWLDEQAEALGQVVGEFLAV